MAAQTITKVPYVDNETVIGAANLNAIQDAINDHASLIDGLDSNKVDKVAGKGLSTNDFNNDAQSKLSNLPSGQELDTSLGQKVDKRTSGTEVYTHTGSTQGGATLTETPTAGAVPQYGTDGVLKAGAPAAANDVVRKAELDEVVDEMSDSTTGLNSKAPAIYETVSGAIASFADGADGMPFKKLVASIEPVQDLHGYDSPWPAGGGKNLIPSGVETQTINGVTFTVASDGVVTCSGTASDRAVFYIARNIPLKAGTYKLNGSPTNALPVSCYLNFGGITGISSSEQGTIRDVEFTLAEDANTGYVRFDIASGTNTNGLIFKPMLRLATETDATFAPYSNICPIKGWTGAEISRTGKNLFDKAAATDGKFVNASGQEIVSGDYGHSSPIKVKPNTQYCMTGYAGAGYFAMLGLDENRNPLTNWFGGASKTAPFVATTPGNCAYIILNYLLAQKDSIAFYESDTVGEFIPCTGSQISVTFPQNAGTNGTVYGGTLTINPDKTGNLVVNKAFVDLGTLNWGKVNTTGPHWRFWAYLNDMAYGGEMLSSQYKHITPQQSYFGEIGIAAQPSGSNYIAMVSDERFSDAATFKTAMNGVQLVYELADPVTHQLTATEIDAILTTLYGTNNIWSNTGDTEVTYSADTKLYIDGKITEAIANALNS